MKFNRLFAFTFGVVITAGSVSAVSFVDASGDATIKACANKKTGNMRYIAKGKCKKSEKALTWNQRGLQGAPGLEGPQGLRGEAGTIGISGSSQQVVVTDASGGEIGLSLSVDAQGATVLSSEGQIWRMDLNTGRITGENGVSDFYSDSQCQNPLAIISNSSGFSNQMTYRHYEIGQDYSPASIYADISDTSQAVFMWVWTNPGSPAATRACTLGTQEMRESRAPDSTLLTLTPITPPAVTGPLRITVR